MVLITALSSMELMIFSRFIFRPDAVSAEHVKPGMPPRQEHPDQFLCDLSLGEEHLEYLVSEACPRPDRKMASSFFSSRGGATRNMPLPYRQEASCSPIRSRTGSEKVTAENLRDAEDEVPMGRLLKYIHTQQYIQHSHSPNSTTRFW